MYAACQFYRRFPHLALDQGLDGLLQLPGGKDLSWSKVRILLLPGPVEPGAPPPADPGEAPPDASPRVGWQVRRGRLEHLSRHRIGQIWSREDHARLLRLLMER